MTALALVCFPEKADLEILERILAGGLSKMMEAGCTIIGGHSIRDDETKFGYSVTGLIDPERIFKNGGAKAGDKLLFTKSLGTGVISTAIKKGVAKQPWIDDAVASMITLNKAAGEVIAPQAASRTSSANDQRGTIHDAFEIHALTDVTGFGLIGHLREMLLASENVSARVHAGRIPLLEGALECVRAGHIPGGLNANRDFAECVVSYNEQVSEEMRALLFDPQTAGGLLIAVSAAHSAALSAALESAGVRVSEIGEIHAGSRPLIVILP